MTDHPLRPVRDRRLGEPLPHQLANLTRAYLEAKNLLPQNPQISWSYAVLASLSTGYPPLLGKLPTHYSPVRHWYLAEAFPRLTCMY